MAGDPAPDSAGVYYNQHIAYDGHPTYRRADGLYYIWWDSDYWAISPELGSEEPGYWGSVQENVIATYTAVAPYTGSPIVTSGV